MGLSKPPLPQMNWKGFKQLDLFNLIKNASEEEALFIRLN